MSCVLHILLIHLTRSYPPLPAFIIGVLCCIDLDLVYPLRVTGMALVSLFFSARDALLTYLGMTQCVKGPGEGGGWRT